MPAERVRPLSADERAEAERRAARAVLALYVVGPLVLVVLAALLLVALAL